MARQHIPTTTPITRLSKRRLIENGALVRKANEKVQKAIEAAFPAKERDSLLLHFYCECTDASCVHRITISPVEYKKIHRNRRRFIVKPAHWAVTGERLVEQQPDYVVIEKLHFIRVRRLLKVRLKAKKTKKT